MNILTRPTRHFLPEEFSITTWENLKPWFDKLLSRTIASASDLRQWFADRSELESVISEDLAWRYIKMTCYTDNESYNKAYEDFVVNLQPAMAPLSDQLNRKAQESPFLTELEHVPGFNILIRNLKKEVELFREANIPLFTTLSTEAQRYAQVTGAMTIDWDGQELTLPQAGVLLLDPDRTRREAVYAKMTDRRLLDKDLLEDLFTGMVSLRHQVALNAGFTTFRDYMFAALGRFDYTPADCFDFHEAIGQEVVPLLNELNLMRQEDLKVKALRPWDKVVDPLGRPPLKPFATGADLTTKGIEVFKRVDPYLGECLEIMNTMGHLDLESRKGKAPGGYNYPLAEIGVPFIFMNATSTLRDMVTLMHEGGHAVHNFLTRDLELNEFKSTPSEVAELASMSMELISMDHWDVFFEDKQELNRAKREHLEDIIETLPWVATIDKFQHWIYEHAGHTRSEREEAWLSIYGTYADTITDWSGYEPALRHMWHKQLHLYEVPFYYIEYGMAQLGAIAVWRNYRADKAKGLEGYKNALKTGNLKTIPEVYKAAGIRFDFSRSYIRELMQFVKSELAQV